MDYCKRCQGEGEYDTPDGVRECGCKDLSSHWFGLPKKHRAQSLHDFTCGGDAKKEKAFQACCGFVELFPQLLNSEEPRHSLLLMGTPGTGRTMLAAVCGWNLSTRYRVCFWNEADLILELKDGMKNGRDEEITRQCSTARLFILDDLGNEKQTEWVTDKINLLVNRRYQNQAPMIITTNLSREEIGARYGERMLSRLSEMCTPVVCVWEDYRKRAVAA